MFQISHPQPCFLQKFGGFSTLSIMNMRKQITITILSFWHIQILLFWHISLDLTQLVDRVIHINTNIEFIWHFPPLFQAPNYIYTCFSETIHHGCIVISNSWEHRISTFAVCNSPTAVNPKMNFHCFTDHLFYYKPPLSYWLDQKNAPSPYSQPYQGLWLPPTQQARLISMHRTP